MHIIVCPGIHPPELTESFLTEVDLLNAPNVLVFPAERYPAYSAPHILMFLWSRLIAPTNPRLPSQPYLPSQTPLLFISFSAGVVGAIAAARLWQWAGGQVTALIAMDGWGVPLYSSFPIYRFSHDYFTHWSSALLGSGDAGFYADPAVPHLDLWRSPGQVRGWWISPSTPPFETSSARVEAAYTSIPDTVTTAAHVLRTLLNCNGEMKNESTI